MKRILIFLLLIATLCSLISCQNLEVNTETGGTADETTTKPTNNVTTLPSVHSHVAKPLTQADLDAIPIANASMSEAELRQICIDFMRLQLTFYWTPSKTVTYKTGSSTRKLESTLTYSGLPYISSTSGNLYKAMMYYDSETGVLDMTAAGGDFAKIIGNQCSASAYWAWARISDAYMGTSSSASLQKNGAWRIGNYTYSDSIQDFYDDGITTSDITAQNGTQVMFDAYSKVKPADGMVTYAKTHGHVIMVASEPTVVYRSNGEIDGDKSFVLILEQISSFSSTTQPDGTPAKLQGGVDTKCSFTTLYQSGYLPYSIPELCGKDDVEAGTLSFSISDKAATSTQLRNATVTSNYPLSNASATIRNSSGEIVYTRNAPFHGLAIHESDLSLLLLSTTMARYDDGTFTLSMECRIGNGEVLPLWSGTILPEA